jgi:hypothetical protein
MVHLKVWHTDSKELFNMDISFDPHYIIKAKKKSIKQKFIFKHLHT